MSSYIEMIGKKDNFFIQYVFMQDETFLFVRLLKWTLAPAIGTVFLSVLVQYWYNVIYVIKQSLVHRQLAIQNNTIAVVDPPLIQTIPVRAPRTGVAEKNVPLVEGMEK